MQAEAVLPRLGRYALVRPLGTGGMAELFLARSDGIGGFSKLLALKRILPHKASNEKFVRMLLNEARLVAGLDHPNIAQVYDIGCEEGTYFFTMEYVHGADLRRVLHVAPRRRLQLANALHVVNGVCAGLHHAHEARDESGRSLEIVHRDVSPSNVIVSYQGAVKLVDFGVARAANLVSETNDGVIKGKHGYMSPEQCLGETLTRRSDVFNVGILLWEMTTGRRLYKVNGDLVAMQRVVYIDAPRPSRYVADYPPELEAIVMRALARDPAKRYPTAEALQLDLESFVRDQRLPVSAVATANEMQNLFRQRVQAWQEAQVHGRSLADHLAEVSSEEPVSNTPDELDDVIGELAPATGVTAPERPAPPVPSRRSYVSTIAAATFVIAGAGGATWFVLHRHDETRAASAASTSEPPPAIDAALPPTAEAPAQAPEPPDPPRITIETSASAPPSKPARKSSRDRAKVRKPEPAPPKPAEDFTATRGPIEASEPVKPAGPRPGTVDPAGVRASVRGHLGEIEACVSRARMEDRDLTGRVVLQFAVDTSGRVTGVVAAPATQAPAGLVACMTRAAQGWTFPAPAGNAPGAFTYPFAF